MNRRLVTILIVLIAIIAVTVIYFSFFKPSQPLEKFEQEPAGKSFKIYVPSFNSLVTKEIFLQKDPSELKNVEKVLENFLTELSSPLKETRILGIYRDRENTVYIDLSKNFTAPKTLREEYFTLVALYRTLKENFSWIKDVKILIDSREVETLSGHISIESSLKEALEES